MDFIGIAFGALIMLGIVAAIATWGSTDDPIVKADNDCASCTGKDDCKLAELKDALKNKNNPGGFKIPGYRSGNKVIALCASIAYAFIPFFGILNLLDKNYNNFFFGITFFIASIIISLAVFNYRDYLSKLPGANSTSPVVRTISRLLYIAALVVLIVLAFGFAADSLGLLNR